MSKKLQANKLLRHWNNNSFIPKRHALVIIPFVHEIISLSFLLTKFNLTAGKINKGRYGTCGSLIYLNLII